MVAQILATKLYIPQPRPSLVPRPRLVERLNEGSASGCKLTLLSAPAGFGKTTLVSEWIAGCGKPVAWLSLDEGDNDPARFISYLVRALQTIHGEIGENLLAVLQSPQPLQIDVILTMLLNEISAIPGNFLLVLDDYHTIDSQPVDQTLTFLIDHQPPQMHLVIATREDPSLPMARLRARGQCTELRLAELRFTPAESAEFLNRMMGLNLSEADIAALEARTEGWIAGLQLAAISMRGVRDTTGFIQSFTGSNRFVLDYLLEEVLQQQPVMIQTFLLRTSILDRLCGPLCDAVLQTPAGSGEKILQTIERANLFIIPLDHERHWYRYHHLFGNLLQKRLQEYQPPEGISGLHIHASEWYEANDLMLEAFRHAAAAEHIDRAERLMESSRMPHHIRGAAAMILAWLESLPKSILDARPSLWWGQAAMLLVMGQVSSVEEKLQAAETALNAATPPDAVSGDSYRHMLGRIAAVRANLAQADAQMETIFVQARLALEYLSPDDLGNRSMAIRSLGFAYFLQDNPAEAGRAYAEALALGQASGDVINILLASIRLGQFQESMGQLHQAAGTYQNVLQMVDEYTPPNANLAYLGLARIFAEWNDLDTAEKLAQKSVELARQYDQIVDRLVLSEVFIVWLRLARRDLAGAVLALSQAEQTARQKNFTYRAADIAAAQVNIHLHQGNLDAAAHLAMQHNLRIIQARVLIAQGNPSEALKILVLLHQELKAKGFLDQLFRVMVLEVLALNANGEKEKGLDLLGDLLRQVEPEGYILLFVDKREPMQLLIAEYRSIIEKRALAEDVKLLAYTGKLLAAFAQSSDIPHAKTEIQKSKLYESLTPREMEVLQFIAQGLSNDEICQRLFLALDTVKGHNRRIFEKLHVQRRTEAIARARELGLI